MDLNPAFVNAAFAPLASQARKSCFVIMPYGTERKHPTRDLTINFDKIYESLIRPAVESAGLECSRADHVKNSGLIHKEMINRILSSDIVVVDITTGNPNVLYELGVRHTARMSGTLIIRLKGDNIPFNINGMRAIDYDISADEADLATYRDVIKSNLEACLWSMGTDSLVHTLIPGLNLARWPQPITARETYEAKLSPRKSLCVITGNLLNVEGIDIWVNPENTKMQMGRYHDDSISAAIRYHGARKDGRGAVVRDSIRDALSGKIGKGDIVEAGTVIATTAGQLAISNNVRMVLHVAAQHGEPGRGYVTVRGYADCVNNALDAVDTLNQRWRTRLRLQPPLTSIIFPLLGTRGGDRDPQMVADNLVSTAREYLERYPQSSLQRVYFSAYTDRDKELCDAAFHHAGLKYDSPGTPLSRQ